MAFGFTFEFYCTFSVDCIDVSNSYPNGAPLTSLSYLFLVHFLFSANNLSYSKKKNGFLEFCSMPSRAFLWILTLSYFALIAE